jgi:N-acetylmuramoyl-L-alanine amidase
MRPIDLLLIHCSATKPDVDVGVAEISEWHKARGFDTCGYHYVIRLDGSVENGRTLDRIGAHAAGHNAMSIGICLVGGLDSRGKPSATFNREQYGALVTLLDDLRTAFPKASIMGHRDLPNVKKDCPCFDVRSWCAQHGIDPNP